MPGDGWDERDDTVVADSAFDDAQVTPLSLPKCTECGSIVFFDDFTEPAHALAFGLFQNKQCLASRTAVGQPGSWYWCANAGATGKYVAWPPAL